MEASPNLINFKNYICLQFIPVLWFERNPKGPSVQSSVVSLLHSFRVQEPSSYED